MRFTAPVRRGLVSVRSLLIDALDDNKPPASSIVQGWTAKEQREFNRAMEWMESLEETELEGKPNAKAEGA